MAVAERFIPGRAGLAFGAKLARRPDRIVKRVGGLSAELARVAAGRGQAAPARGDRRFGDAAWDESPVYSRLLRGYLAAGATLDGLLADARLGEQDQRRVRFALQNVHDALAPTNYLLTNPAALRATVDERGANLVRGARNLARDMASSPRLPASVDAERFEVGVDIAATPGSVVLRTELFELIRYAPQTATVREEPLLIVPPMVNKYYLVDLAPERSMVEFLVRRGQQVFTLSWRNPEAEHRHWGLDTYADGALEAIAAVRTLSGAGRVHLAGNCSGGALVSMLAARAAALGREEEIGSITTGVSVLDSHRAGTASAFMGPEIAKLAVAGVERKGYLDGAALQTFFAWLRPNDLIWGYVANNYLLGRTPPAFDILFWNADTTRMSAGLLRDLADMAVSNALTQPSGMDLLGTPVDLGRVTRDAYVVAGVADHITPWENCYATTQLLGGDTRFVLSSAGHVAALVNPPANPKARYRTAPGGANPASPHEWAEAAEERTGSWWEDWARWLGERSGGERRAPKRLGKGRFRVLGPAPGRYVLAS
jgi:class II poly(R)-hydroxyalkanoic acid synthase